MHEITEDRLASALGDRAFQFSEQAGSTNDLAREWALRGAKAGSVVLTEEQLTGRGRFGRQWSAPAGTGLLMSVVLRPNLPSEMIGRTTMIGAVAVADVLARLSMLSLDAIGIKWPNDVQLNGRKVCGVLAEGVWNDALEAVILGIGLNIRVDFTDTPLAEQAISVERAIGGRIDRVELLEKLLQRVDYWAARAGERALLSAWRSRLVTIGQQVQVRALEGGQTAILSGLAIDVDDQGALLVRTAEGEIQRVLAGDVTSQLG
jgi:BirA family transcriptional regulator, biotin operon repressor / biotin---[acetyl-CoA-carboxylase] ligase